MRAPRLALVAPQGAVRDGTELTNPSEPARRPSAVVSADGLGLSNPTAILAKLDVPILQPGVIERAVTILVQVAICVEAVIAISAVRHRDGSFSGHWTEVVGN